MMKLHKYHALGNDYIVIDPGDQDLELTPERIERICHRNFGFGSDGILLGPLDPGQDHFGLKIYNPDGSEAEKSGNGLRIFSRYLHDRGLVSEDPFTVHTAGGDVQARVHPKGEVVTVEMGRVSFDSREIPVTGKAGEVINDRLKVAGRELTYSAATIGNPHCVLVCPEISEMQARDLGPLLEIHENFPNRTNVQFLEVIDRRNIRIEIWERGAGYTLASGSSSSAAAAVAHRQGLVNSSVTVHMPGGILKIEIADGYDITMTGPVTKVAEGNLHPEVFENRTG
jgi:diaminopimelate epimerase